MAINNLVTTNSATGCWLWDMLRITNQWI